MLYHPGAPQIRPARPLGAALPFPFTRLFHSYGKFNYGSSTMVSTARERDIAIVGVAESDVMGNVPNKSSLQHHAEAAHNALADAGLKLSDINGLMTARLQHPGHRRVLRVAALFHRQHFGGRFLFRHSCGPRRRRHPRRVLRHRADYSRAGRTLHPRSRAAGPQPAGGAVRNTLRDDRAAHQLRHGLRALYARVRRGTHPPGAGRNRSRHPQVGQPEPGGLYARDADVL